LEAALAHLLQQSQVEAKGGQHFLQQILFREFQDANPVAKTENDPKVDQDLDLVGRVPAQGVVAEAAGGGGRGRVCPRPPPASSAGGR